MTKKIDIGSKYPEDTIGYFDGDYAFLSNFHESEVMIEGIVYPTAEHAFQVMKNATPENIKHIKTLTAGQAKRFMRKQELRRDWEQVKVEVMYVVVRAKFNQNEYLGELLLATDNRELVEGNYWGDRFWGVYGGQGGNHLGKILMRVRTELEDALEVQNF